MVQATGELLKARSGSAESQAWSAVLRAMSDLPDLSHPPDICLLLRAYAEQRWLNSELLPQLLELERSRAIADEQLGTALA